MYEMLEPQAIYSYTLRVNKCFKETMTNNGREQ